MPAEWITLAASWAPALVSRWLWVEPTRCTCVIETPRVQNEVVELLSRQLDRCGPQNLTVPRCGDCPAPPPDHALLFLAAGAVAGFCVGVALTLAWVCWPTPGAAGAADPSPPSRLPALETTPAAAGRRRAPPGALGLRDLGAQ